MKAIMAMAMSMAIAMGTAVVIAMIFGHDRLLTGPSSLPRGPSSAKKTFLSWRAVQGSAPRPHMSMLMWARLGGIVPACEKNVPFRSCSPHWGSTTLTCGGRRGQHLARRTPGKRNVFFARDGKEISSLRQNIVPCAHFALLGRGVSVQHSAFNRRVFVPRNAWVLCAEPIWLRASLLTILAARAHTGIA